MTVTIHPCITGGKHEEFKSAHGFLSSWMSTSGLTTANEVMPVAVGHRDFGTRDLAENGGNRFLVTLGRKLDRRPDIDPPRAVMIDYEPTADDDGSAFRSFMTLSDRVGDNTLKYMAAMVAATRSVLPNTLIGFYGLPILHGTGGYTGEQLAELARVVKMTTADLIIPSMKVRRSTFDGISFEAQRRRVRIACEQLRLRFDGTGVQVWPETSPIIFGRNLGGASEDDGRAQMLGFADAGMSDVTLWLQGERSSSAKFFFDNGHGFVTGMASAKSQESAPVGGAS
jgi:hypothetical protein